MTRCLIVDDEAPARELIRLHLSGLEGFEIAASLNNGQDALAFLQEHTVDLAFIDIQMPKISGLELIRSLKQAPRIILTTAFREFAVQAYDLDVLDYLVKPITRERFMQAISRYMHYRHHGQPHVPAPVNHEPAYQFFKVGREQVKIFLEDIVFIEGSADYIKVHTTGRSYMASEKLGYMEKKLPENGFVRIHKSYIVALNKLTGYNAEQVRVGGRVFPLGRLYKAGFFKKIQGGEQP